MNIILGILTTILILYYLSTLYNMEFKEFLQFIYNSDKIIGLYNMFLTIISIFVFSYAYYCMFKILEIINN